MSGFTNRRSGPNVAQFLRELQTPTQPPSPEDGMLEDELAMFTNAQFNDWESQANDFSAPLKVDAEVQRTTATDLDAASPAVAGPIGLDFSLPDEFNSFDFGTFASPVQSFPDNLGNLQPLQPNPSAGYPAPGSQHNHYPVAPSQHSDDTQVPEASGPHRQLSFEDQSRMAAEEDKRKRNTAASARFRIKKKAREQALEKREKELAEEVSAMKNRITHLETENKWLRGLVMEKAGAGKDSKFDAKLSAFLKTMGRDSDSEGETVKRAKPE